MCIFCSDLCGVCYVNLSEIEKKLVELDKAFHSVLGMVRRLKGREECVVCYVCMIIFLCFLCFLLLGVFDG